MSNHRYMMLIFALMFLFISTIFVGAQDGALTPAQQAQTISPLGDEGGNLMVDFPPPVYTLRDTVTVRGRVLTPNLQSYFLEFRPLVIDADETPELEASRPWFPASLPSNTPVADGQIIGQWNTLSIPDGLYELRLVALTLTGERDELRVAPLRVENQLPDFLVTPTVDRPPLLATPTPLPGSGTGGTGDTTSPPTTDTTGALTVTAIVDANVRRGDDTIYDRVGFLLRGETARVLGISSFGSGWFYIEMNDGQRGFIAPNTVRFTGNVASLSQINPPPPPTPIATATPLATATPVTNANLLITGQRLDPVQPVCNEAFAIYINVTNNGTTATSAGADVNVVSTHVASGTVTGTTVGAFPVLQPGENFVVLMYLTVSTFFDEEHRLTITVNPDNIVPETNYGDNSVTLTYTLAQGTCG